MRQRRLLQLQVTAPSNGKRAVARPSRGSEFTCVFAMMVTLQMAVGLSVCRSCKREDMLAYLDCSPHLGQKRSVPDFEDVETVGN